MKIMGQVRWIQFSALVAAVQILCSCASHTRQVNSCQPVPPSIAREATGIIIGTVKRNYSFNSPSSSPPFVATIYEVRATSIVEGLRGEITDPLKLLVRSFYDASSREFFQPILTDQGFIGAPYLDDNSTSVVAFKRLSADVSMEIPGDTSVNYEVVYGQACSK